MGRKKKIVVPDTTEEKKESPINVSAHIFHNNKTGLWSFELSWKEKGGSPTDDIECTVFRTGFENPNIAKEKCQEYMNNNNIITSSIGDWG